jgi:hypothetical protein
MLHFVNSVVCVCLSFLVQSEGANSIIDRTQRSGSSILAGRRVRAFRGREMDVSGQGRLVACFVLSSVALTVDSFVIIFLAEHKAWRSAMPLTVPDAAPALGFSERSVIWLPIELRPTVEGPAGHRGRARLRSPRAASARRARRTTWCAWMHATLCQATCAAAPKVRRQKMAPKLWRATA